MKSQQSSEESSKDKIVDSHRVKHKEHEPPRQASILSWSPHNVSQYVGGLTHEFGAHAAEYAQIFEAEKVNGLAFVNLNNSDLKDLGLSLGHRKVLLHKISTLRPGQSLGQSVTLPDHGPDHSPDMVSGEVSEILQDFSECVVCLNAGKRPEICFFY